MELKITSERVLEAAGKCTQAKETLKTLFPEAFMEEKPIFDRVLLNNSLPLGMSVSHYVAMECRGLPPESGINVEKNAYEKPEVIDANGLTWLVQFKKKHK